MAASPSAPLRPTEPADPIGHADRAGTARLAAAARLDGPRSTAAFRILLEAIARPGVARALPHELHLAGLPAAALVPLALADLGVTVAVHGHDRAVADQVAAAVRLATGAPGAPPADAAVVVLLGPDAAAIDAVSAGTELAPESAARVAVQVEDLRTGTPFRIDGPGVPAPFVTTAGVGAAFLEAVRRRNARPPAGIDLWITDRRQRVLALPRSSRLEPVATLAPGEAG